ncbi:MAG TPA: hypothetical protein DEF51_37785 [Myxococcales bacterium]|nr:hypothetical protein [Myxococcales bacterium]
MSDATLTPASTRPVDHLLARYGESHQNDTNERIHWICVPVIVWTVIALLWSIPTPDAFSALPLLNWATLTLAGALAYYVYLSPPLAAGLAVFSATSVALIVGYESTALASTLPLWGLALSLFVLAWIGQFVGHQIEGKKPSFLDDLTFLLIGPAWLLHFVYRKLGVAY